MTCTPWATSEDAVAPAKSDDMDEAVCDQAMLMASDILFNLTRQKYRGRCTDTVRPIARWRAADGRSVWPMIPGLARARYGFCSCNRSADFGCGSIPEIALPRGPVIADSVSVKIDGADFGAFAVNDRRTLVRTDGLGWPCCQDLLLSDDETGTWSVTYEYGRMPPPGGVLACAVLGSNLYATLSRDPDAMAGLPDRLRTIVRQNMTAELFDPLEAIRAGLTGLPAVDLWIISELFGDSRRPGRVIVPGRGRSVRRTA